MSRALRGLTEGLQTGMRLGSVLREAQQREDLARAYGLTPQEQLAAAATPEQLQRAQAETQALQQQDIAEFGLTPETQGLYAQRMPQEGMRVAPPTYTLGSQTFQQAPTQEQIDAARVRAAADVYGRYGDAARREELMRGLRAEERALAAERRAQTGFETQQREAGLRLGEAERKVAEQRNYDAFLSALPPDAQEADIRRLATEYKLTPTQQRTFVADRVGVDKGFMEQFATRLESKLQKAGNDLNKLQDLYNSDPDFDDKTDMRFTRGPGGAVRVEFVDKATKSVVNGANFSNAALAVEYLRKGATDPANIGTWALGVQTKEQAIAASKAATRLSEQRYQGLATDATTRAKLADIEEQYAALTPAQQMGAEGRALKDRYNMLSAGPGKTVPVGTAPRGERTQLSPGEVTNRAKALVEAREKNPDTNKPYTLTEALRFVEGGMRDPVAEALDKALGGGGDPFAPSAKPAGSAAPAATATPVPALRRDVGERNPFVDAQGRPLPNAPAGAPSLASQAPAAIQQGVSRALSAGERNYAAYLQSKIDARQPLTADEAIRARRFGLTP